MRLELCRPPHDRESVHCAASDWSAEHCGVRASRAEGFLRRESFFSPQSHVVVREDVGARAWAPVRAWTVALAASSVERLEARRRPACSVICVLDSCAGAA